MKIDGKLEICGDEECPQFCVRLNEVSVTNQQMNICATITVFGNPSKFPYEFCETIDYNLCGSADYFYAPCERVFASSVFWDGGYLASLDMPRIANNSLGK